MKKGILVVVNIKNDPMGNKYYKLITMIQSLYYPPCEKEVYPIDGKKLEQCMKQINQ